MHDTPIAAYLEEIKRRLSARGLAHPDTLAEIESHLQEATAEGQRGGLSRFAAEQEAIRRFGPPNLVAEAFADKRQTSILERVCLAMAGLAGISLAYVNSRPTWDDTGILVVILLAVCGAAALVNGRRPWLMALAAGIWIPLFQLASTHSLVSFAVLGIAFAGAYCGWVCRIGIRQMMRRA